MDITPDDLERLKDIAADLRARLARLEARISRLEDARWREFQKERVTALGEGLPFKATLMFDNETCMIEGVIPATKEQGND